MVEYGGINAEALLGKGFLVDSSIRFMVDSSIHFKVVPTKFMPLLWMISTIKKSRCVFLLIHVKGKAQSWEGKDSQ